MSKPEGIPEEQLSNPGRSETDRPRPTIRSDLAFPHLGFVIDSSFVIRISSFYQSQMVTDKTKSSWG
jgi:hypothetical protein